MHVALVIQRYGKDIVGGAESHARLIVEQLTRKLGWNVDIYTSTAIDHDSWKNFYKKGTENLGQEKIKRFPVAFPRIPLVFKIYNFILSPLLRLTAKSKILAFIFKPLEKLWYILQGPYCPSLLKDLKENESKYEKIFFFTYLYYPTAFGLPQFSKKAIIIPTAHDESPFFFNQTNKILNNSLKILSNCSAEMDLINKVHAIQKNKMIETGIGLDHLKESKRLNAQNKNSYLLYLGRIDKGKNTHILCDYFLKFCEENPNSNLKLHLAGKISHSFKIPNSSKILYLGQVNDDKKNQEIMNSLALINPSQFESLSMIILEGMALKVPLIVNKNSEVLNSYANTCSSVFSYSSYDDFSRSIKFLETNHWESEKTNKLQVSQDWVFKKYSWDTINNIYFDAANDRSHPSNTAR